VCKTQECSTFLAAAVYKSAIASNNSVSVQLDSQRLKTIQDNRHYVKSLLECVLYCAQQGIAFRDHRESDHSATNVGNFRALVLLLSQHNGIVKERLEKSPKNASWLGHDI
jgi:hypothetical protein